MSKSPSAKLGINFFILFLFIFKFLIKFNGDNSSSSSSNFGFKLYLIKLSPYKFTYSSFYKQFSCSYNLSDYTYNNTDNLFTYSFLKTYGI